MNRDLSLIPTLLFLASIVIVILMYAQRAGTFYLPPVGQIFEQSGEVRFLFKNEVLSLDEEKFFLDLDKYGVEIHQGQLGIAYNGDVFVNTFGQSSSLLQNLLQYYRVKEKQASGDGSSLLKCTQEQECMPWGSSTLRFDRAWSMFEVGRQHFVINDTSRHQLHLVDSDGQVLDTLDNFLFPNHLFEHQGSRWVVNTNTNSFIELDISQQSIKRSGKSIDLRLFEGIPKEYRFPTIAYSSENDRMVVLTHTRELNQGKVFWLDDAQATPVFENLNDITALFLNESELYVADYETQSIWKKDLTTGGIEKLDNKNYRQAIEKAKQVNDFAWTSFLLEGATVLGVGLLALLFAILKSTPSKLSDIDVSATSSEPIETNGQIHWVKLDQSQLKKIKYLESLPKKMLIAGGVCFVLLGLLMLFTADNLRSVLPGIIMVVLLFIIMLPITFIAKGVFGENFEKLTERLGWDGEYIHLKNMARSSYLTPSEVYYTKNQIYGKGVNVPVQALNKLIFDKSSFEKIICPILDERNKLTMIEMMKHQMKSSNPDLLVLVIVILLLPLLLILISSLTI